MEVEPQGREDWDSGGRVERRQRQTIWKDIPTVFVRVTD